MIVAVPGRNQTVIPYAFHSVTAFKDLYALHTDLSDIHALTLHISAPPLTEVLCYSASNVIMHATDFYLGLPQFGLPT